MCSSGCKHDSQCASDRQTILDERMLVLSCFVIIPEI